MHPETPPARPRTPVRSAVLGIVALAMLAILAAALFAPSAADAQVPPYKAYGSGLRAGEVVRAFKGAAQVGQVTVTAAGTWDMNIPAGGEANVGNGDRITFTVDGRAAAESVTFAVGHFVPPPGLTLTTPAAAATPTPAAVPAPSVGRGRLAATPIFDPTGRAFAVFNGGTVYELAAEAARVASTGVWAQDASGAYVLYIVGGPAFLADQFRAKFPSGFPGVAAVTLVK